MPKLHQVLALRSGRMSRAKQEGDTLYKLLQKHALATGGRQTFEPAGDLDLPQPAKIEKVQLDAAEVIGAYIGTQAPAWDITATMDEANTRARADVKVGGQVILSQVPVTTLLFLEKQLTDLRTVISKAPVLDPSEDWGDTRDPVTGLWHTEPVVSFSTKKVVEPMVLVQATKEFPAQVKETSRDVKSGTWTRIKQSGALTESFKNDLLMRVTQLIEAVKAAREEGNSTSVDDVVIAKPITDWLMQTEQAAKPAPRASRRGGKSAS